MGMTKLRDKVVTFLPSMEKRFKRLTDDLITVTLSPSPGGQGVWGSAGTCGGQVRLHAGSDGGERYLTAQLLGDC